MDDSFLLEVFLDPLRLCAEFAPAFGRGKDNRVNTVEEFREIYDADVFYSWVGLSNPLMYAAHKSAGGMTSIYRQLGTGCERVFREVVKAALHLSEDQVTWSYSYKKERGKDGTHTLDARIELSDISDASKQHAVTEWMRSTHTASSGSSTPGVRLNGAVFEIRQGYKSADSKRQNADLRFGMRAYQAGLLPVVAVFSNQVSMSTIQRYRADQIVVLTGVESQNPSESTFAFAKHVLGYDLSEFFRRNSQAIKTEVDEVLTALLTP